MKKFGFATIVASGLTAAVLGLAATGRRRAERPWERPGHHQLASSAGYNVIVNRVGSTPLDQASVVAVRPGQTYSRTDSGNPGDDLLTTVTDKTVYVDVK
jgi:hypothetical protein